MDIDKIEISEGLLEYFKRQCLENPTESASVCWDLAKKWYKIKDVDFNMPITGQIRF